MTTCPRGHEVRPAPYCSVCGVPLDSAETMTEPRAPAGGARPEEDQTSWLPLVFVAGLAVVALLVLLAQFLGKSRPTESSAPEAPPATTAPATAEAPAGTTTVGSVTIAPAALQVDADVAHRVAATFDTYFGGINAREPDRSLSVMAPRLRETADARAAFAKNVSTSNDSDVVIQSLTTPGTGAARAAVTFTSTQSREYGEEGNTCLHWSLVYTLQDVNGAYQIEKSEPVSGKGYVPC